MTLRLFNTLTRKLEDFTALDPAQRKVGMYVCGMTVYDLCHMGHARMMMAFDVVYRWLQVRGYEVNYVRNITDIDDKIIRRALERGITIRELTDEMIAAMREDIGALGIKPPTHEPRATEHVGSMLDMIATLEGKGLAYRAPTGDVNLSVRKLPGYGRLSGKSLDDLRAGAGLAERSDRADLADAKVDPLDSVLWKASKPEEPEDAKWPSVFGPGRPGWHIECSAMCLDLLGKSFDIHGGGMDLQFPHHENELAQSEAANGEKFASYWLHNGFLNVDGEKMSKSLGNFFTIRDVLKHFDGETLRFFMLRTHYRSQFNFSDALLEDARNALRRLYNALDIGDALLARLGMRAVAAAPATLDELDRSDDLTTSFEAAMDNDFNTAEAVSYLFMLASDIGALKKTLEDASTDPVLVQASMLALDRKVLALRSLGATLGILQQEPLSFLQAGAALTEAEIQARIAARAQAKKDKDFAASDRIRKELADLGITLKDGPEGTTWVKA